MKHSAIRFASLTLSALLFGTSMPAGAYSVVAQSSASAGTIYVAGGANCRYGVNGQGGVCSHGIAHYGGTSDASVDQPIDSLTATHVAMMTSASGGGASAVSNVSADLRTASIHLLGSDSNQTGNCSSAAVPCGGTNGSASLRDVLHFTVPGATAASTTTIVGRFTLEGSMRPFGGNVDVPNSASGELYGALTFGGVPSRFDLKNSASTGFLTQAYLDNYPSGISPTTWTTNGDHTVNVSTFSYSFTGATSDVAFGLDANLQCGQGFVCDFANTAKFELSLPAGVNYGSDSGVFLTGVGGVPEPTNWTMMLAGFGFVGLITRRRQLPIFAA